MDQKELPVFDSVVKALVFACNASDAYYIASPVMNKAMAAVPVKKAKKRKLKASQLLALGADPLEPPEPKARPTVTVQPGERLQGLNKAMQAGFILGLIDRLDKHHALALRAAFTTPTLPCQCQAPCCQGFRLTPRWVKAINGVCEHLRDEAIVVPSSGKVGMGTKPALRLLLVETFFLGSDVSMASIARRAEVSVITASKHGELIWAYLDAERTNALQQIADLFDQEGITGWLP